MFFFNSISLLLAIRVAAGAHEREKIPSTCFVGKICPWGYGQVYTIYESAPNLTTPRPYPAVTFEASQTVDNTHNRKPHNRIYTITTMTFSGFGSQGCVLDFQIPCNSTVPFYHHGNAIVAARALQYVPSNPTWSNVIPLIEPQVLGTFGGREWKRNTFDQFSGNVCGNVGNGGGQLSFVYGIDDGVKESADVMWNQTVMNADIVVGVFANFTC